MGFFSSLVGGVVGFLVGGPVGAIIGAGIGATKVGEKIVNTVMDFVLQPFMPSIPSVGGVDEAQRQQGVLIQRQGTIQQIPVVYGYRKVGGIISFAETGATNNKYLYVAYVFSEGLVEGLREVYIDDWLLPVNLTGNLNAGQLVNVNADRYNGRVQLRWFPGVYYQDASKSTVGSTVKGDIFAEAPSFTSNMVYNGLAVLFARYEWKEIKTQADADSNPFNGSIPEVKVAMLGKRVASLTTDATEASTYDANIVRYSTNPAECLLDYLRNPRYGKGLINNDIDWLTWKRAARKCNQTVTYVASGIQGPILTMNAVIDTNNTIMANTKTMLQNFRAYMPYVQGKYKLKIEDAGNETDILSGAAVIYQTLTKDDIVSDITFNGIEKSSKYNVVSVTYVDPDQKFSNQTVVYPETEAERQVYIDRDGGRENKYDVTLGCITNYAIAKDMARLIFNKQRRQESCVFTATSKALELEPGDNIRIQSNILNFGTDPWRVVSIKINNDMTVDLGCVRNPDDIYPYVRVGEEDIVLPTYIPKGSIIYFPGATNPYPLGLVPPIAAVFPPDASPVTTNPPPTDPNAPGGGGVGGDGPIGGDPTTPVPPDNNNPTAPPPPPPFAATLKYLRTEAPRLANGNFNFTVVFAQPADGLYDRSTLWWRLNRFSAWKEVSVTDKPGANGEIKVVLGELPNGIYDWYARSYATDGRASDNLLQGQSYLVETGSPGNFLGTGSANTISASGFVLPQSQVPEAPRYDADIDYIEITPQLSGGAPLATRRMTLKIQQIQDTRNTPVNMLVSGVKIYYKLKSDTYWNYETITFPPSYVPGQIYETALTGDFGSRVYPSVIIPNTVNDNNQRYDFLARLIYSDGTPSEKQVGPGTGLVETFNGLYDYPVWGRRLMNLNATSKIFSSGDQTNSTVLSSFNTDFLTVDSAPPGVVAGLDIVPNVFQISSYSDTNRLDWVFQQPTSTKFRGYKIRWREIISGENPVFNEVTTPSTGSYNYSLSNQIDYRLAASTFQYNRNYDFVITAQVLDTATNTIVDATNSLTSRVRVLNSDPEYTNLVTKFNFQTKDTKEALNELKTSFPASPLINVRSWDKIVVKAWNLYNNIDDVELVGLPSQATFVSYLNTYYQVQFQVPTTTTHINIYRRVFHSDGLSRTTVSSVAKYHQLGPWEKIRVDKSTLTAVSGWYTLNLRGPIAATEWFDDKYEVAGFTNRSLVWSEDNKYPAYTPWFPKSTDPYKIADVRPYYGHGNNTLLSKEYTQFLFVLEDALGEANNGILLRSFYTENVGSLWRNVRYGFVEGNIAPQEIPDINAEFNTAITAGYDRRLSEALTSVALSKMRWRSILPGTSANSGYGPGTYNRFLQQPRDGRTVI